MSRVTYSGLMDAGRLGNQLWQIGATLRFARERGAQPVVRADWMYRSAFSIPDEFYDWPQPDDFDLRYRFVEVGSVEPFYQELRFIAGVERELREWFEPSEEAVGELARRYGFYFDGRPTCSVHVRRTDYVGVPDHFPVLPADYYRLAVSHVHDPMRFLVFSDDPDWCEQHLEAMGLEGRDAHVVRGITHPWETRYDAKPQDHYDLLAMALCDRHIIANSTFSWWGAWLSQDNRVLCPNVWYGPKVANFDRCMDCLPDGWLRLEARC